MIIQEKIKSLATDDAETSAAIGGRMFQSEAAQDCTAPFVVFMMSEDPLHTHNTGLQATRRWKLYLYVHANKPGDANRLARVLKRLYCLYKETAGGAADTDIESIQLETGEVDLGRDALTKRCCCSLVMDVWEQIA